MVVARYDTVCMQHVVMALQMFLLLQCNLFATLRARAIDQVAFGCTRNRQRGLKALNTTTATFSKTNYVTQDDSSPPRRMRASEVQHTWLRRQSTAEAEV